MHSLRNGFRTTPLGIVALAMLSAACSGSDGNAAPAGTGDTTVAPHATASAAALETAPAATAAPGVPGGPESSPRRVVVGGVDLTGIGYDKGSATAPVVVVNFSDFGCPFCGKLARETEPVIEREYVQTGKVFFKYVPFVMGMFPNGEQAARASECAAGQGKFWRMHDRLYAGQADWKRSPEPAMLFKAYAAGMGLDSARFSACYASPNTDPRTQRANDAAQGLGVRATPSFAVNGRGIEGALPLAQFRQLLDAALKEAK